MNVKRAWSSAAFVAALVAPMILAAEPSVAQPTAPVTDFGRGNPGLSVRGKSIDQRIAEFMERHDVPGMAMAIVQAPYIPRSAGYGRASLTRDELASTRTMWGIGPITQGFTAVAILQLQEAGKLEVTDTIDKHLPDLPAAWGKTTILELLQHASGIADFRSARSYDGTRGYRPAELLALVAATPPLFKAGTQVRLSATNFVLLGLIIERASGMSYRAFITRQQIEPLGLRATMFVEDFPARSFADRPAPGGAAKQHSRFKAEVPFVNPVEPATGYRLAGGALAAVEAGSTVNLFAFGALWSSAEDISLWDIALAGGILVRKEESRALIYQPTKLANGVVVPAMAGWEFTRHPGFMEIEGSAPGFSAYLSRFTAPADLVCVTLLANREGLDLAGLAREIAESYKAELGAGATSDDVVTRESKFSVDETVARLEARLRALNVPVFAQFDHAENARQAGMQLRPTKVLVFGNPRVGTKLMQEHQAIALDLPLRLSVWEDERGRTWVSYRALDRLAAGAGITDKATVLAMESALASLVARAANVYED